MEPNVSADTISDISLPNLSISSSEFNEAAPLNDTTDIVRFYSKHNATLSALKDAFTLAGKQKSTYFIKKDIERHVGYNYFFHIWCDRCKAYKAFSRHTKKKTCFDCIKEMKLKETNYFVFIPLKQQLKKIVDRYKDEISKYHNEKSANNIHSNITDIHDGSMFQNILRELPDKFPLSLVLNIDGVKIFNFGNDSLWPVQVYLNFLPPKLRFLTENILVVALYYGPSKNLDIHALMLPLCQEMTDLYTGFKITTMPNITFVPLITHVGVDLPAKYKLICFKQYNSEFGCSVCYQKGINVHNKGTKGTTRRFLYTPEMCPLRSHAETLDIMTKINPRIHKEGVKGIKDISPLVALEHFDLIQSIGIDYMHGTLRGAFLKEVGIWLDTKSCKKAFYISKKSRDVINKRIMQIKGPSGMPKPRQIDHFSNFKAHEFRDFLLFYMPVILDGIVPKTYLEHLKLLSESIYILLKSEISENELNLCEKKLNQYVRDFQNLYTNVNVTMNVHMLRHVIKNVKDLGPLWAYSTFGFESNNGQLKRYVKGTSKVILQVVQKYVLNQSLASKSELISVTKLLGVGRRILIEEQHKQAVNQVSNAETLHIHTCVEKNSKRLTSTSYKLTNSIDYFLLFNDGDIGKALYYFKHEENIYVLFESYITTTNCSHLTQIQTAKTFKVKFIENIKNKLIYIGYKFGISSLKEFVCNPPNYYEGT